jgi:hypothetical protein
MRKRKRTRYVRVGYMAVSSQKLGPMREMIALFAALYGVLNKDFRN